MEKEIDSFSLAAASAFRLIEIAVGDRFHCFALVSEQQPAPDDRLNAVYHPVTRRIESVMPEKYWHDQERVRKIHRKGFIIDCRLLNALLGGRNVFPG